MNAVLQEAIDLAHVVREETNDRVKVFIRMGTLLEDGTPYAFCELNGSLLTCVGTSWEWERMKTLARQIVGPSISA